MFVLCADKVKLTVRQKEAVTSGSVNACPVRFEFSPDWDGLDKTAVFRARDKVVPVLLGPDGETTVPWEVLTDAGCVLYGGVYGKKGGETVLPTVWVQMASIEKGAAPGSGACPPTPELWEQGLAGKGDRLDYTDGGKLGLYAGEKLLSAVTVQSGAGAASDHRALTHRDAAEQHPIEAITGLSDRLSKTMTTDNALSVSEILKIMEVN